HNMTGTTMATKTTMDRTDDEVETKRPRLSEGSMLAEKVANLSPLEKLPKELLWKIIDFTPEEALSLRLSSNTMRALVDQYSLHSNIPLVKKLSFCDYRMPNSATPEGMVNVMMTIEYKLYPLFFLRLTFVQIPQEFKETIKDFAQVPGGSRRRPLILAAAPAADAAAAGDAAAAPAVVADAAPAAAPAFDAAAAAPPAPAAEKCAWQMNFNVTEETPEKIAEMDFLGSCCGRRVAEVSFGNIAKQAQYAIAEKVLDGTQIVLLHFGCDDMTDETAAQLLSLVEAHNVDRLSIQCCKFDENMTRDSVQLLRTLSQQVHSLRIYQTPLDVSTTDSQLKVLFGTKDIDWADLICEMFAGKLDKLQINNRWYPKYLTAKASDTLVDKLPNLGKKVWFEATCETYVLGIENNVNGHLLKADAQPDATANQGQGNNQAMIESKVLRIKHETRANEKTVKD
ncbi:hypothetical protein PENTCL1PPCAC_19265, partial [Pristionchus entomophagus]